METKICSKCGIEKPVNEFYKDRRSKDGLRSHCKECHNLSSRKWRSENPEKQRERCRKWQADNPERNREHSRKWAADNREKRNAYQRKRYREVGRGYKKHKHALFNETGGYCNCYANPATHPKTTAWTGIRPWA